MLEMLYAVEPQPVEAQVALGYALTSLQASIEATAALCPASTADPNDLAKRSTASSSSTP